MTLAQAMPPDAVLVGIMLAPIPLFVAAVFFFVRFLKVVERYDRTGTWRKGPSD